MIPRYSRPDMVAIWEPANRFRIWFEIEAHACDAMAKLGVIPKEAAAAVWKGSDIPYTDARIERIDEIERETRHDVIAFLTELAEHVGEQSRFVHQGMTSSDVLDTCLAVQLKQAADILLADVDQVLAALERRAREFKMTPCIGRSHGIHAEPTTFGVKLAGHYAEFKRCRDRLVAARVEVATCAISGAVGTFANVDPKVAALVAEKLGLTPETVSTQVIPRDRHAMFFAVLGVIASAVERLSIEIRHLQRTEVREAQEYFAPGQKGSSAMPHKRNPILTENLTGLARLVRSAVVPAMENVALWHERDISHSSVERMIGPDATITLDFALARLAGVVDKLVVYPANMAEHLNKFGGIHDSQRVLLTLTQKGVSREGAYKIVQRAAMNVWRSFGIDPDNPDATIELTDDDRKAATEANRLMFYLARDPELTAVLSEADLKELFGVDPVAYHT
ncbi:MAG: adenylosuccinate lyase, partial [Rhodospirillaceae bacterium]